MPAPQHRPRNGSQATAFSKLFRLSRALLRQHAASLPSIQCAGDVQIFPTSGRPDTSRHTPRPAVEGRPDLSLGLLDCTSWFYSRTESTMMSSTQSVFSLRHAFPMGKKPKMAATREDVKRAFGERLKALCADVFGDATQTEIAKEFDLSQSMVGQYFRGAKYPANDQMSLMAIRLGVYREYLETGRGDKWMSQPPAREVVDMADLPVAMKTAIRSILDLGSRPNA